MFSIQMYLYFQITQDSSSDSTELTNPWTTFGKFVASEINCLKLHQSRCKARALILEVLRKVHQEEEDLLN